MQPYQRMEGEVNRQNQLPAKDLSTAFNIGTSIAGASLLSKALPMMNKFIPADLAIRGLNKLSPTLGGFAKKAMDSGFDFEDVRSFISGNGIKNEESKYRGDFPNLFGFIDNQISNGAEVELAADLAYRSGYDKDIEKLEKKSGQHFADILDIIYRMNQKPQEQQQPQEATQVQPMQQSPVQQAPMQTQPQDIQQAVMQQPGPASQKLISILQELQSRRKQ